MADALLFDKYVVARKKHRCAQCGAEIPIGTQHRSVVQIYDGQFAADRTHLECDVAFKDLNFRLRGAHWEDELHFLIDDDIEDGERDWLREAHPIVAARLWPPASPSAAMLDVSAPGDADPPRSNQPQVTE